MHGEVFIVILIMMSIFGAITSSIASSKGRSSAGWFIAGFLLGINPVLGIIMIIVIAALPNLKEQKSKEEAIERENRRLREQLVQEQIKTEAFRRHASARLDAHDSHIGVDTRSLAAALPAPDATPGLPGMDGIDDLRIAPQNVPGNSAQTAFPQFNPQTANEVNGMFAPAASFQQSPPANLQTVPATNYQHAALENTMPYGNAKPQAASAEPAVTAGRQWYFERQGTTQGPITDQQLVDLAKQGKITTTTLIWTEQLHDWKPAGTVKPLQPYLQS